MSPKKADHQAPHPGAIWLRPRPASRGQSTLTREAITGAAVRQLDAHGQVKLSLRTLAEELGVHATTLYWHIAARDDLLDLALDAVFAEIPLPEAHDADWRTDVRGFMHGLRGALLRHPWAGAAASSRPLLGPAALTRSEFVYAALTRAGLSGTGLTAAAAAVSNLVISDAASQHAWSGQNEAAARRALTHHLTSHIDDYPTLAQTVATSTSDRDSQFHATVELLINGLRRPPP